LQVPANMWEGVNSHIKHASSEKAVQQASSAYVSNMAEILDKEFYANN
jgi:hypothetical protein